MNITSGSLNQDGSGAGGLCAPPAPLRWRRVFCGEYRQLAILRRWLAALLPDCAARDDVISVATELAANAVGHTASGQSGWFAVEIIWHDGLVRVAVADQGSPTGPEVSADPTADHGRGLVLVRGLSRRTGVLGSPRSRIVWADVLWTGAAAPTSRDFSLG
jgi:histidine kinase-like protein